MVEKRNQSVQNGGDMDTEGISYKKVAEYFIALSNETENLITNLKLQKLIYYTQAWSLALNRRPLFSEDFEAWVHGPVLPSLYNEYKQFQWMPINKETLSTEEISNDFPIQVKQLLKEVVDEYFGLTAYQLERLTHAEEPWIKAREGVANGEPSHNVISKELIQAYYSKLVVE